MQVVIVAYRPTPPLINRASPLLNGALRLARQLRRRLLNNSRVRLSLLGLAAKPGPESRDVTLLFV